MSEVDRKTLSEKDKNKLNKIDKLLLKRKLKREKIDISDDDLDIVINTYNHLLDFYLEDNRKHSLMNIDILQYWCSLKQLNSNDVDKAFAEVIGSLKEK